MTRHDVEAWLDHRIGQMVHVETRHLMGGEVSSNVLHVGVLERDGENQYLAGASPIDLTEFVAANFEVEGVVVELDGDVELYITDTDIAHEE
jgi:hypothetical protein